MAANIIHKLRTVLPALAGAIAACSIFLIATLISVVLSNATEADRDIDSETTIQVNRTNSSQSAQHLAGDLTVDVPNPGSIGELLEIESEYVKRVTLRHMLAHMDEQAAVGLLVQTTRVVEPNLRLRIQRQIVQKLAALDPLQTLAHIQDFPKPIQGKLMEVVFEDWLRSKLNDALAHAKTLRDHERLRILKTVYRSRDDLSRASLNKIAQDLGYGGMAIRLMEDQFVNSASNSPRDSWNQILEDDWSDYSQVWSLIAIADAWMCAEGDDVIFQIAESIPNHLARTEVIQRLLSHMSAHDAPAAFDYATSLHEQTDDSIFRTIVFRWTAEDPQNAMKAVSRLDNETLRGLMLETIANRWAYSDPRALLEEIDAFPGEVQKEARSKAIGEIARTSPMEAIDALGLLPIDEVESAAKEIVLWWSMKNVQDAVDWIQNDSIVQAHQKTLFAVVLQELARGSIEDAMQFVLEQPMDYSRRNLEFELIDLLLEDNRIEETLPLLSRMRESGSQFEAYVAVGTNLIVNKDIDRALELANQLPVAHQKIYLERLLNAWAYNDAQKLFHSLKDLSDQDTVHLAARALSNYKKTLNESQIEHVNSLLEDSRSFQTGFNMEFKTK